MLSELVQRLARSTPARCEVCRAWPAAPVCAACLAEFGAFRHRCRTCAIALPDGVDRCGRCLREPPPLEACHAAASYGFPWAGLIARFKFSGHAGWADTFAGWMLSHAGIRQCVAGADLLVPMPLAPQRLAERGFNQAWELARRLAPGKADAGLVVRLRDTPPQARLDRAARLANLRHAFAVEPLRARELAGRSLVLVDDVMTSGASLFTLAAALRRAGAAHVCAVVLARTED